MTIIILYIVKSLVPDGSDVAPSVSMVMFSELSAVPMDASDSGVSSSDVRGSKINISYVSSSLHAHTQTNTQHIIRFSKIF